MTFTWFTFWLVVHIFTAIVAFGPTFVFPVVGPYIERNPQHAVFGFEVFEILEKRLIIPVALTMPVSGIGLIATGSINFFKTTWLTVAVGLYVVALALAIGHQVPATARIIAQVRSAGAASGPDGRPPTLPAEVMPLLTRTRLVGMTLAVLLLTIVLLMVWHPGTTTYR